MLPLIAHYLTPEAFGKLEILATMAAFASIVVGFGLTETLFRFAADAEEREQHNVIANVLGATLILGSVILLSGLVLIHTDFIRIEHWFTRYDVTLILATVALEGLIAIPLSYLRFKQYAFPFFIVTTSKALLQASLVFMFLVWGRALSGVLEAGLIAALIQAVFLLGWQLKSTGIQVSWITLKPMLPYAWPLVMSALVAFVLSGLDRWIVAGAVDFIAVAQYGLAAKFALAAALLLQPFSMWWFPRRFQVIKQKHGREEAALRASQGSQLSLLLGVVVVATGPLLVIALFPESYHEAIIYIPWLVAVMVVKDNAELLNLGCYMQKSSYYPLAINTIASLVGLVLMLIGVMKWDVLGVLVALLLAQIIRLGLYFWKSQQLYYLPYPHKRLVISLVSAILLGVSISYVYRQVLEL